MPIIPKNHDFQSFKLGDFILKTAEAYIGRWVYIATLIGFSDLNRVDKNVLSVRSDQALSLAFSALNRNHTLDRRTLKQDMTVFVISAATASSLLYSAIAIKFAHKTESVTHIRFFLQCGIQSVLYDLNFV